MSSVGALQVYLRRLPDTNDPTRVLREGYVDYGRYALLRDDILWFGPTRSSHPPTTNTGWYWAVDRRGNLTVSARGASIDLEKLLEDDRAILRELILELMGRRILRRVTEFHVNE